MVFDEGLLKCYFIGPDVDRVHDAGDDGANGEKEENRHGHGSAAGGEEDGADHDQYGPGDGERDGQINGDIVSAG